MCGRQCWGQRGKKVRGNGLRGFVSSSSRTLQNYTLSGLFMLKVIYINSKSQTLILKHQESGTLSLGPDLIIMNLKSIPDHRASSLVFCQLLNLICPISLQTENIVSVSDPSLSSPHLSISTASSPVKAGACAHNFNEKMEIIKDGVRQWTAKMAIR